VRTAVVPLRQDGFNCSTSTVGRVITRLKERGVLKKPVRNTASAHCWGLKRLYDIRKPKDYQVSQPGDPIQEGTYNTIRPHQALGYLTPLEFLKQRQEKSRKESISLRY